MIDLQALSLRIGRKTLFDGITFRVEAGQCAAALGANGAGKSLLMRVLAGELRLSSGTATVGGHDLRRQASRVRRVVGVVGEPTLLSPRLTVAVYLEACASANGVKRGERAAIVEDALALTELADRRNAELDTLSRGEAQRLELARVLAHDPSVLLLDEPLDGLDPLGQAETVEMFRELKAMGKTLLIATRDPSPFEGLIDHAALLERGRQVAAGDLEAFRAFFPDTNVTSWRDALLHHLARLRDNAGGAETAEEETA